MKGTPAAGLKIEPGSWVMFLVSWLTGAAIRNHGAPVATPFSVLVFLAL